MSLSLVDVVVIIQGVPVGNAPAEGSSPSPVPVLPSDSSSGSSAKSAGTSIAAVAGGAAGGVLALGKA